jgi:DNA invertase Pin-like site-specific DNA recombinase
MPAANRLTVGVMAMVADEERRMISKRTKEALAVAKPRGVKLGGYRGAKITRKIRKAGSAATAAIASARAAGPSAGHCRTTGGRVAAGYCGRVE